MNQGDRDAILTAVASDIRQILVDLARVDEAVRAAHKRLDGLGGLASRVTAVETRCDSRYVAGTHKLTSRATILAALVAAAGAVVVSLLALLD